MFPGAGASREEAAYAIVGAPLDASTTYQPGTRFGPDRIRQVARSFEDYDHHSDSSFSNLAVHDHGDVHPGADVDEYLTFLESELSDFVDADTTPLLVGGEHTVTIAGVRAVDPDVYVCLDAHLDLRESFAGDPLSHATVTHHVLDVVDEAIILGARSGSEAEWGRLTDLPVTAVPPGDVPEWSPPTSATLYCSVDIDVADPAFAPGTGTPEPFGLTPREIHRVVRDLAPQARAFDVVEVNDRDDGQAAILGAKLLRAFVYTHAVGQP